jgi:hypothetical protein
MSRGAALQPGKTYHVYNRGNNGENVFVEDRNYAYFLKLYAQHVLPIADTGRASSDVRLLEEV